MKQGSAGSAITVTDSEIIGTNNHPAASGTFATVTFEDNNITMNLNTGSTIKAIANNESLQYVFNFNGKAITATNSAEVVTEGNAAIINNFVYNKDAQVIIGKKSIDKVRAEGYVVDINKVLLGKPSVSIVGNVGVDVTAISATDSILVVASYKTVDGENARLVDTQFIPVKAGITEIEAESEMNLITEGADMAKAFLINDFTSLTPLCEAARTTIG